MILILNNINNGLIDLRNDFSRKEFPENENPKTVVDIIEKIIDFDKQQKDKELSSDLTRVAKVSNQKRVKISTPKQMLNKSRACI